jgi:SAM-dependent methyltransferase
VSDSDRSKWNERYRAGAYQDRPHPSAFLVEWLPRLPRGRALDLACGAGRNAVHLAAEGFEVDGVDISREGLARAAALARDTGVSVRWLERDLDAGLGDLVGPYDLVVMIRYVNVRVLCEAARRLVPGGYLLCEEHLVTKERVAGPQSQAFRMRPGELSALAGELERVWSSEGLFRDPDGETVALARLVARRPHELVAPPVDRG